MDLSLLAARVEAISLVDLDRSAIESGMHRQGVSASDNRLRILETALTGVFPRHAELGLLDNSSPEQIRQVAQQASTAQPSGLPEPADVVVSIGLITQLVEAAVKMSGEANAVAPDSPGINLVQAIRRRHLRLLSELTSPGRSAILVTEVVSSKTLPELPSTSPNQLPALLQSCLATGNFFTGLHPGILYTELNSPEIGGGFEQVRMTPPWLWQFTARTYAVVALTARKQME